MASSAQNKLAPNFYNGATSAPPPTPSVQPNNFSTFESADVLSKLLHRLPPTLSLVTRRSPPAAISPPPKISFSNLTTSVVSSAAKLGYFQLTDHFIPNQLASSAESCSLNLFNLTQEQKNSNFPKNWPIGYDGDDDGESFCFDASCFTESIQINMSSLSEFTREMEKVGLEVIESLSSVVGFGNPYREDPTRVSSLMWISEAYDGSKLDMLSRVYPYIVGLHYQIRTQKYSLLADSGWVSISPEIDSVLVTIGDIAQVYSNGKLKKVKGNPVLNRQEDNEKRCITMSLLMTLPLDTTVAPLLPKVIAVHENVDKANEEETQSDINENEHEKIVFKPFAFEDYAWRVYNQRVFFKDPLDKYRI